MTVDNAVLVLPVARGRRGAARSPCLKPPAPSRSLPGVAVLVALLGCGSPAPASNGATALPVTLDGLALIEQVAGAEAQTLIAHLHPGPLAPSESEVGFYASEDHRAVLYVSRFGDADTALAQLDAMSAAIGRGRGGFGHHAETEIGGTVVHAVMGQGRAHFFFTRGRDVLWVSADPETARAVLDELLQAPPDSARPH